MATYFVSLERLARSRGSLQHHETASQERAVGVITDRGVGNTVRAASADARAGIASPDRTPRRREPVSAAELLDLPPPQLWQLVAEEHEPTSRLLLAVMYRLAVVDTQLADLNAHLRGGISTKRPRPKGGGNTGRKTQPASKSELLEKVFRKNLLLREDRSR